MPDAITPAYRYRAVAERVHDGDTFELRVDLGFDVGLSISCRLRGVNAPELNTDAGKLARDFARATLMPAGEPPAQLIIESYRDTRSFARWVCDVWIIGPKGAVSFADELVAAKHAVPFDPHVDHWTR